MTMACFPLQGQGTASPSQKELTVTCYKTAFLLYSVTPSASGIKSTKQVLLGEAGGGGVSSPHLNTQDKDAGLTDTGSLEK